MSFVFRNARRRREAGIALLEILLVLAIISTLALTYTFTSMDRTGPAVKGTLNALHGALADARSLARGSGQPVTVTPSGSGADATFVYETATASGPVIVNSSLTLTYGPSSGRWSLASEPRLARHSQVDPTGATTAATAAVASLKASLKNVAVDGGAVFSTSLWTNSLADPSRTWTINNNGTVSAEGYIAVVGARGGAPDPQGAVGVLLLNASGSMLRYYRPNASSPWVRL